MIIIIDAYNLLRSAPLYKKIITDKERAQFINSLSSYARRKGHKVIIVFDGGPHEWPFKENMKIMTIVYSGIHETADDYIKEYIEIHKAKDLLLVSSDSELTRFAGQLQIPSIDSVSFSGLVKEALRSSDSTVQSGHDEVVKFSHENNFNIDELMMAASKSIPTKSEDFAPIKKDRGLKSDQNTKDERALLKKLNKL